MNYPGEFGGGVINLTTPAVPRDSFLNVGIGTGGDVETTFNLGYTYYGSDTDVFGFDDGARRLPDGASSPWSRAARSTRRPRRSGATSR